MGKRLFNVQALRIKLPTAVALRPEKGAFNGKFQMRIILDNWACNLLKSPVF